ncbi:MAG TPA: ABC transporter permease [Gaiellaceae bacterium]|nr:ABC transporter permease [Gaiellaceae bacterium]
MSAPELVRVAPARLREPKAVGVGGILLGVLAFWLTLPPAKATSLLVPVLVGALAAACGAWAVFRGARRVGWGAIVAGALGAGLGIAATHSGRGNLTTTFAWSALIASMLVYSTPLTYAAIGGLWSERSGVVNIGLEGMMLTGAFFGIWGADKTGNWLLGLLIAMGAGGLLALVYGFFAIHLRTDQIVGGTAINFLALGITGYLFIDVYGSNGTPDLSVGHWLHGQSIPDIPISQHGGFFETAFGDLNLMVWIAFAVLILTHVIVFRTPLGLRLRSVGEHPRAADTVGISVFKTRYAAVTLSGMLSAMGGAYLSIGFVHSFNQNMTEGRGFIALAALIFGKWRPAGAFAAALLFGFSSALAQRLGTIPHWASYAVLFQALPYVLTLIAVAGVIGRSIPPAADGQPYTKQ